MKCMPNAFRSNPCTGMAFGEWSKGREQVSSCVAGAKALARIVL